MITLLNKLYLLQKTMGSQIQDALVVQTQEQLIIIKANNRILT